MSYNPCGNDWACYLGLNQGTGQNKTTPSKPTTPRSQPADVPVRNNTPLTSRFEGINTTTPKTQVAGAGVGAIGGAAVTLQNTINQASQKAKAVASNLGLPEWAIPAGIVGLVVLIVLLIRR